MDLDAEFHFIIQRAAHNQLLEKQLEVAQTRFAWLMRSYHCGPHLVMIKIPDIIEAMKQRDAAVLERMLVEHLEYFVDRLREETMKKFDWIYLAFVTPPEGMHQHVKWFGYLINASARKK